MGDLQNLCDRELRRRSERCSPHVGWCAAEASGARLVWGGALLMSLMSALQKRVVLASCGGRCSVTGPQRRVVLASCGVVLYAISTYDTEMSGARLMWGDAILMFPHRSTTVQMHRLPFLTAGKSAPLLILFEKEGSTLPGFSV